MRHKENKDGGKLKESLIKGNWQGNLSKLGVKPTSELGKKKR